MSYFFNKGQSLGPIKSMAFIPSSFRVFKKSSNGISSKHHWQTLWFTLFFNLNSLVCPWPDAMAEVEAKLAGSGRILLRPSGTEPLVRVMVEGKDPQQVESLCRELADVVEKAIA